MDQLDDDRAALERFVHENPARVAWLAAQVRSAPPSLADRLRRREPFRADLTAESLVPLWRWVRPRIARRGPADAPTADPPTPRPGAAQVPEPFRRPSLWPRTTVLAEETVLVADAVARYLGECLRRARPSLRWALFRDPDPPSQLHETYVLRFPDRPFPLATPYDVVTLILQLTGDTYVPAPSSPADDDRRLLVLHDALLRRVDAADADGGVAGEGGRPQP